MVRTELLLIEFEFARCLSPVDMLRAGSGLVVSRVKSARAREAHNDEDNGDLGAQSGACTRASVKLQDVRGIQLTAESKSALNSNALTAPRRLEEGTLWPRPGLYRDQS